MKSPLQTLRAGLAEAMTGLESFVQGETEPTPGNVQSVVASLCGLDELMSGLRSVEHATRAAVPGELFRAIVESAPTAIILADGRGCITLVNAQTEKLFGYRRDELLGRPVEMLIPKRFARRHGDLRNALGSTSIVRPMGVGRDLCGCRKDGTEVPLEIALSPVQSGGAGFTLAVLADITERTGAERLRLMHAGARQRAAELEAQRERECSTAFQRAVLPATLPAVPGCTFDALYEPGLAEAQVGGDWYDAVHLIDGRILLSIGDVSGSGLESAVVVGVVRQVMRGIAQLHPDPMLILDAADRALYLEYPGVYVSAWVGLLDLVERTITYASAGHPPPLAVAADGTVRELNDPHSLLIGLREGFHGHASVAEIAQGDTLVLYTDGMIEAGHDVIAGIAALHEAAAWVVTTAAPDPADAIRRRAIPAGSFDDVAVLVARTDGDEAAEHCRRWQFDVRDATAAAVARGEFVASLAAQAVRADDLAAAELIFSELIGNVVRHAGHAQDVVVVIDHRGAHSVLHVLDHGGRSYHIVRRPPDPYAECGRGTFVIATTAIDFTVCERPGGGSHARVVLRGGSHAVAARPALLRPHASL
ncbi:MAG: SpoIIE family protein phosphatase [Candidatus Velthaea sp.]